MMNMSRDTREPFRLVVFEQNGSGDYKIAGIEVYSRGISIEKVLDVSQPLPDIIDEPEEYITSSFAGDMVLNFLKHPDLSEYLVRLCVEKDIPVIASGQTIPGAICPFTCCGLENRKDLGKYGAQFGMPEYRVVVDRGIIKEIEVVRGATCGATWQVINRMIGVPVSEAESRIGREIQFLCMNDPSAFDPVSSKSALHYAGEVHMAALRKALDHSSFDTGRP